MTVDVKKLEHLRLDAGLTNMPTPLTYELRMAVSGEGPRAHEWADKPHRLLYDACREIERLEALSPSPQGEGYDGSKSLGERLYEAHRTNWPKEWPVLSVWIDLPWSEHARWERVALSFVSRLSDGGEGSSREPSTDTCAAPLASEQAGQDRGGAEP